MGGGLIAVKRTLVAAVAGVATGMLVAGGLTACSGGDTGSASAESASPSRSETPSPTESVATVSQVASVVDREVVDLELGKDYFLDCGVSRWDYSCAINVQQARRAAERLRIKLDTVQKVGAPGYIGAIPDEVKGLVVKTDEAAVALASAADAFDATACGSFQTTDPATCFIDVSPFKSKYEDLMDQIAAWSPLRVN